MRRYPELELGNLGRRLLHQCVTMAENENVNTELCDNEGNVTAMVPESDYDNNLLIDGCVQSALPIVEDASNELLERCEQSELPVEEDTPNGLPEEGWSQVPPPDTGQDENFFENFTSLSTKQEIKKEEEAREEEEEREKPPPEEAGIVAGEGYAIGKKVREELYAEALYTVSHIVGGGSSGQAACVQELYEYARQAFGVSADCHDRLMAVVREESPPVPVVLVTVVEAEGLAAKDPNGFSDPYCMLGIRTGSSSLSSGDEEHDGRARSDSVVSIIPAKFIRTTSVKHMTLSPKWDEKFCFDIEDISKDRLHLDIWDHDDDDSVFDSVRRLNEVSGFKGLGRYFKKIAQSARADAGDSVDDFLGCISVGLDSLPPLSVDEWFTLKGRSRRSSVQGRIRLKLQLATREDRGLRTTEDNWKEIVEHQHLFWVFIEHALAQCNGPTYKWPGDLPQEALIILHQHAVQGDITDLQKAICQWVAYSRKHREVPLDYSLLWQLLEELDRVWNSARDQALSLDEEAALGESFTLFVKYCLGLLVKHRYLFPPANQHAWHKLKFMLKCLSRLFSMDSFKKCCPSHGPLRVEITNVLQQGTEEWFDVERAYSEPQQWTVYSVLKSLIQLTESLNKDMRKATKHYNYLFHDTVGVHYSVVVYKQLETLIEKRLGSDIEEMCGKLGSCEVGDASDATLGTTALELYFALQEFAQFRSSLPPVEPDFATIVGFYVWFKDAVHHWFVIAKNKARDRIQKAVELDEVEFVDAYVNYSSSAVDTTTCLAQVKKFWSQLKWPDAASSYSVVMQLVESICSSAVFYSELCCKQLVNAADSVADNEQDITGKDCIPINNIERVYEEVKSVESNLGIDRLLQSVAASDGEDAANERRNALYELLQSTEDSVVSSILGIVHHMAEKMRKNIKHYVFDLSRDLESSPSVGAILPLMRYLDKNLEVMHGCLSTVNFQRALEQVWQVITQQFYVVACGGLNKDSSFSQGLYQSLCTLEEFFCNVDDGLQSSVARNESFQKLEQMLALYKTDSAGLIESYYLQKLEQQSLATAKYGFLTVKASYDRPSETLSVEVLNAGDLLPFDQNGFSDPFVIVELLPKHAFPDCKLQKTKVQKKTLFPLFDETFEFQVPLSDCLRDSAIVSFTVMDHDVLSPDDFEGVAYLAVSSLPGVTEDDNGNVPQNKLFLMESTSKTSEIMNVLQSRTWDKLAQNCVKQERKKHFGAASPEQ